MLLFSTILNVKETLKEKDFIQLLIDWNQNSSYKDNRIKDLNWDGESLNNQEFIYKNRSLKTLEYRNEDIVAARYERTDEEGLIWTSDFILNLCDKKLAIQLDRSFLNNVDSVSQEFSTPRVIQMLIQEGYLEDDNNLPVNSSPYYIHEEDISLLTEVINGTGTYRLPIVYVSKKWDDTDPIKNLDKFAYELKGVAHVFVEETQELDEKIGEKCDNQNAFNGAIGIYYPNQSLHHKKIRVDSIFDGNGEALSKKVIQTIIEYTNQQKIPDLYTWNSVNYHLMQDKVIANKNRFAEINAAARQASNEEKKSEQNYINTSAEVDEYEQTKQTNEKKLDESIIKLDKLNKENSSLNAENQNLNFVLQQSNGGEVGLCLDNEDSFFDGEILEIVLDALSEELKRPDLSERQKEIITNILESNKNPGILAQRRIDLKTLTTGLKNPDPIRSELNALGLRYVRHGKHLFYNYYGDHRYLIDIVCSGSDSAGGAIAASEIINVIF